VQSLLAAEEMRAAADIQQDAVRGIDGDEGRVALAPIGDGFEQARIGIRVFRYGREGRMHGACLRQREARRQSEPFRRCIERHQELEIAALAEDDEGRFLPLVDKKSRGVRAFIPLPYDTVGRKPFQP
jgi:hypothetical protein